MITQLTSSHLTNVDEEGEACVLGSVIVENGLASTLLTILPKPSAFYLRKHQLIYEAIAWIYAEGLEVDIFTITNYLRSHKLLDEVSLFELTEIAGKGVPGNFEYKCRILFQLALRRYLHLYGSKLARTCLDTSVDPLLMLNRVQDDLSQIMGQLATQQETGPENYLAKVLSDLEARQQGRAPGLTTGIPLLDTRTGGFEKGNFVIIAARPATGKSAFLLHWLLHHLLELKQSAGLFTLEMKGHEIMRRALAHQTGFSNFQLQQGKSLDMNRIHQHVGTLAQMPLHLRDSSIQLPELLSTAREWHRRYGISLLAVDYIQLVRDSRYPKAYDRVSEVSTSLKSLAQDTGMVVVGLSQLSRECEKRPKWEKRPVLGDLRESGNLEQDANNVLMLFSPHRNSLNYEDGSATESTLEIHALKLRNGKPTQAGADPGDNGPLVVQYDAPTNRFNNYQADF
ncbi:replicative DNA helicase [Spirosoma sp. KNUC1025]|uniref:replicative DNA helicase n=1 Tax=Spirosoma sp. KNUC1025 TaxID=2894082 RepID=UPI0038642FCA|nr:AAA family ATPase [Spirosoma sp. KNUC1025]